MTSDTALARNQATASAEGQATDYKPCKACGETKRLAEFPKDNRNKTDGRFNVCKACTKARREASTSTRIGLSDKPRSRVGRPTNRARAMRALGQAIADYARREIAREEGAFKAVGNQIACQRFVDFLVANDGRPVSFWSYKVRPLVFAVAREGGAAWFGWPDITDDDKAMAKRYGEIPALDRVDLEGYPEWLPAQDYEWNPTNHLNLAQFKGLKRVAELALHCAPRPSETGEFGNHQDDHLRDSAIATALEATWINQLGLPSCV